MSGAARTKRTKQTQRTAVAAPLRWRRRASGAVYEQRGPAGPDGTVELECAPVFRWQGQARQLAREFDRV